MSVGTATNRRSSCCSLKLPSPQSAIAHKERLQRRHEDPHSERTASQGSDLTALSAGATRAARARAPTPTMAKAKAFGSKRRHREPAGRACRGFEILPLDTLENATYKTKRLINLMVQYSKPADQLERPRRISRASSDDLADWSERYRNILKERLDRLDQYRRYPQTPEGEEEKSHGRRKRRKQRHL